MALLLPLIVLAAYFLLRNPQRRRAQAQKALLTSLQPGARVATASGIIGTVVGTEGDRAALEIAPGVIVEFLLAAITRTIDEPTPPDTGADHQDALGGAEAHEALDGAEAHDAFDGAEAHDAVDEAAPQHEEN
jgi:preprotein translocase subunit YajC